MGTLWHISGSVIAVSEVVDLVRGAVNFTFDTGVTASAA